MYESPNFKCIHLCSVDCISRLLTLSNSNISIFNGKYPLIYVVVSKFRICKGKLTIDGWIIYEINNSTCEKWVIYTERNEELF